jgi:hypothetical protein
MKLRIFNIMLVAVIALVAACADDEGVTYSVSDVSSRISGFSNSQTGPGADLTINGSDLGAAERIFIGNEVIRKSGFLTHTDASISFKVPTAVPLGTNNVLVVFAGPERAYATIPVVALPAIITFVPGAASTGETVTIIGTNLDLVTEVKLGAATAAITSKTTTALSFTVPAGITTGKIQLVSAAATVQSAADLVSCTGNSSIDCNAGLNPNVSFEAGTGDNFDNWNKFNGATKMLATTSVATNEVYRGTRALRVIRDGTVVPGTDQWRIQLASDYTPTDNGASYTVYAWVRASVAGASFRFSNQDAAQYGPDTAIPVTWTRISWTFTSNATQKRIVLDLNGTPQTTFFIDDVKLIKN